MVPNRALYLDHHGVCMSNTGSAYVLLFLYIFVTELLRARIVNCVCEFSQYQPVFGSKIIINNHFKTLGRPLFISFMENPRVIKIHLLRKSSNEIVEFPHVESAVLLAIWGNQTKTTLTTHAESDAEVRFRPWCIPGCWHCWESGGCGFLVGYKTHHPIITPDTSQRCVFIPKRKPWFRLWFIWTGDGSTLYNPLPCVNMS